MAAIEGLAAIPGRHELGDVEQRCEQEDHEAPAEAGIAAGCEFDPDLIRRLDRNGPRARTIMREHVLAFQREIIAAVADDLAARGARVAGVVVGAAVVYYYNDIAEIFG